jgi:DNA polymerase III subunit epsilon
MLYNVRQSYTPALEAHEFNPHALIIDTETVGTGSSIEVVEVALCDFEGRVILDSLVRPVYNPPPRSTPAQRFDSAEFDAAPDWTDVWPALAALAGNKLLVAYNAAFDRRALAATCARNRLPATAGRGWRCAMQLAKRVLGAKKNLLLSEACARFGLEAGSHRAAADVLATHRLLRRLVAPEL